VRVAKKDEAKRREAEKRWEQAQKQIKKYEEKLDQKKSGPYGKHFWKK